MATWALMRGGVVANVIVCEEGDTTFAPAYVRMHDNDYDHAELADDPANPPRIGSLFKDGRFVPPSTVSSDRATVPPDGATYATVTYTDNRLNPPSKITATVNGLTVEVPLVNGVGQLPVASQSPGDQIVVAVDGQQVVIEVTP